MHKGVFMTQYSLNGNSKNSITSALVAMETDFKWKIVCASYRKTTLCLSSDLIVMKGGNELHYILLKSVCKAW